MLVVCDKHLVEVDLLYGFTVKPENMALSAASPWSPTCCLVEAFHTIFCDPDEPTHL